PGQIGLGGRPMSWLAPGETSQPSPVALIRKPYRRHQMKSIKELAAKASLAAMIATGVMVSTASALDIDNATIGGKVTGTGSDNKSLETYTLASEVDFSSDDNVAELSFSIDPTKGTFSGDNNVTTITLFNATFAEDLTKAALDGSDCDATNS